MKKLIEMNFKSLYGILAIIFGLAALFLPELTVKALGIYFATALLIIGVLQVTYSIKIRNQKPRWYLSLMVGLIGIITAIIVFSQPQILASVFISVVGLLSFFLGLFFLYIYFKQRLTTFYNSSVLVISILSLITAFIILINPFESARVITVIIGIFALIYGVFSLLNSTKRYI